MFSFTHSLCVCACYSLKMKHISTMSHGILNDSCFFPLSLSLFISMKLKWIHSKLTIIIAFFSSIEKNIIEMICNESNCKNVSCALCFHCQRSVCLHHIIDHHQHLIERHASFYPILMNLYEKLQSMSIDQCFHQVIQRCSSKIDRSSSIDFIRQLHSIREELIEQLNDFKQEQFKRLKEISQQLSTSDSWLNDDEFQMIKIKFEDIRSSINSLVYGIHLEMSNEINCRKIFRQSSSINIEIEEWNIESHWLISIRSFYKKQKNKNDHIETSILITVRTEKIWTIPIFDWVHTFYSWT